MQPVRDTPESAPQRLAGRLPRGVSGEALAYSAVFILLVALLLVPLVITVLQGIFPGFLQGSFDDAFSRWRQVATERQMSEVVVNTVRLGLSVALVSTVLGVLLGFLVSRTDLPWRPFWDIALIIPFLTPPFIGAFSWILFSQRRGYLEQLTDTSWPAVSGFIFSFNGLVMVMSLHLFPFAYLSASRAFSAIGASREAVARTLGAGSLRTWLRVTFPLALPGILGASLLVFVMAIEEFGTAAILGRRARVYVIASEIERATAVAPVDRAMAGTLATVLMILAATFFIIQAWILLRRSYVTVTGRESKPAPLRLGRWKAPVLVLLAVVVTLSVVIPWGSVVLTSLLNTQGGGIAWDNFSLKHYEALVNDQAARTALQTSLILAVVAATATTALGTMIAYLVHRGTLPGRRLLDGFAALPTAVPAIVLAVAVLFAWNWAQVPLAIYRSPAILIAGYIVLFVPIVVRFAAAGFLQTGRGPEEAARMLGGSFVRRYRKVVLPLLAPYLFAGWMMVFMITARELVASLILRPPGTTTASVFIFQNFEQGDPLKAMAMAAVMMGTTTTGLIILQRLSKVRPF